MSPVRPLPHQPPPLAAPQASLPLGAAVGFEAAVAADGGVDTNQLSASRCIRQEIDRFESVHPSIYAVYDLIDVLRDHLIAQQLREHVVCIEDAFVNSPEWTLSRNVPDIRLGVLGSLSSGKSSLVHRYLTGTYIQEESPEGGRFKKEIVVEGSGSFLMMIRDEAGCPEWQFSQWVDAVILVFSLENEDSFQEISAFYNKMQGFRSNVPVILVGTQDAISENNPRRISDQRARKLAFELGNCPYYETCATYGLNVEKVFTELCQRLVLEGAPRLFPASVGLRPTASGNPFAVDQPDCNGGDVLHHAHNQQHLQRAQHRPAPSHQQQSLHRQLPIFAKIAERSQPQQAHQNATHVNNALTFSGDVTNKISLPTLADSPPLRKIEMSSRFEGLIPLTPSPTSKTADMKLNLITEKTPLTSTPNAARKNKRRSNIFSKDKEKDRDKEKDKDRQIKTNGGASPGPGEIGSGRSIPVKQGYLLKSSSKGLNKEAKKKRYVTLTKDGRLTYHASLNDYMGNHAGKEIELMQTTVKIPGQNPRGCQNMRLIPNTNPILSTKETPLNKKRSNHKRMKSGSGSKLLAGIAGSGVFSEGNNDHQLGVGGVFSGITANVSSTEDLEFLLISLTSKTWRFEASSTEERNDWVAAIEELIMNSLQACESARGAEDADTLGQQQQAINALKYQVAGNRHCVDCDAPNPDWASLNHGALMCITCSGVHRQLGSHISRVRSLNLDDWSPEQLSVMASIGNTLANAIWEAYTRQEGKPTPNSSREEKERWIRAKYVDKEFLKGLPRPPAGGSLTVQGLLVDGIEAGDITRVLLALAHGANVDAPLGSVIDRTALRLAASQKHPNTAIMQLLLMASTREHICKDHSVKNGHERKV